MAAYRWVYDSRHLQADCQVRDRLRNSALGNRVRGTFTFLLRRKGFVLNGRFGVCVCVTDQRLLGDRAATYGPQDQRWNKSEMLAAKMDKFLAVRLAI